jgi:hypothetical protein
VAIVVDKQIEGILKSKRQKKLLKNGTYRLYDLFVVLFAAEMEKSLCLAPISYRLYDLFVVLFAAEMGKITLPGTNF